MITWQETILRLFIAVILGGLVGIERQRYDWAAGLRTHMLVCLGSALMMIVSAFGFTDILGASNVTLDPSRIAAQVVSGIGFLGAGTIIFLKREVIKGLTTAAGLWTVAGVGLAVGSGMYIAAAAATVLVLIILAIVKPYKKRLSKGNRRHEMELVVNSGIGGLQEIEKTFKENNLVVSNISFQKTDAPEVEIIQINFDSFDKPTSILSMVELIKKIPAVREVKINFS
ncbi:MAG TPA: MgtC/SapB family protein [Chitinophagaceae bacterium]